MVTLTWSDSIVLLFTMGGANGQVVAISTGRGEMLAYILSNAIDHINDVGQLSITSLSFVDVILVLKHIR